MAKNFFDNMPAVDKQALRTSLELDAGTNAKLNQGGYSGSAQDLYNLIAGNYSEVVLPTDGAVAMTRRGSGDIDWLLKKVKVVLLSDALVENSVVADYNNPTISTTADLTGASGQVMVKIPKFYYRETIDGSGVLTAVAISPIKLTGFSAHPKFLKPDGSERDHIYIGAYEASDDGGTKLKSASGVATLTSQALATFRSRAFARGAGWYTLDFWTDHLIQLLFYIHYGTFNSQVALPGYTEVSTWNDAAKRNTGRSNILTTMNGSVDADLSGVDSGLAAYGITTGEKVANRFLFIENIFGHIWKFLDGVAFDGRVAGDNSAWVTNNPALFTSVDGEITTKYTKLGSALPAASNENYIQSLQSGFLPKAHGGNSSTYVTDYFWSYLDDASRDYFRVVRAGGPLSVGGPAGLAARVSGYGLSNATSSVGSRLCAAP